MSDKAEQEMRDDAKLLLESNSWHCYTWRYPYSSCECGKCNFIEQALNYAVKGHQLDESHLGYIEEARDRVMEDSKRKLRKDKIIAYDSVTHEPIGELVDNEVYSGDLVSIFTDKIKC